MNIRYLVVCEHSESSGTKHFISGGGMMVFPVGVQPGQAGPLMIPRFGIALAVDVPYSATSEPHSIGVSIENPDGVPLLPQPMVAKFETGRPPGMRQKDTAGALLSFNIQNLQVPSEDDYSVVVEVDGSEEARQTFRVAAIQVPGMPAVA
jgi:hypothetical protein